jgi:hypothetical protein
MADSMPIEKRIADMSHGKQDEIDRLRRALMLGGGALAFGWRNAEAIHPAMVYPAEAGGAGSRRAFPSRQPAIARSSSPAFTATPRRSADRTTS